MIESIIELTNLRILLALLMLGIASYSDVKKREISDYLWIAFGIVAIILIFFEPDVIDSIIPIGMSLIIIPFVILIWKFGLFGGADAFALIVLAGLAPQITLSHYNLTPFTTLTNAIIISVVPMFINFIRNLIQVIRGVDIFDGFDESRNRRIIAMFVGYRAKNPSYSFSIEKKEGSQKKLNFSLQHAEYTEFCNKPNTWVTPGIPYILFIAAGFIIQLIYGDIIFNFIQLTP